ncbi:MAG: MFS transporter [Actinomycetota bacterium]|nr:MFS transporter [Actinomycetota bacterium]
MSVTVDVEPLSAAPEKTGRRWWMLAAVSIATFMLLLDLTVVNVALPSIQRDLNMSFSRIQWVIDAYSISLASLLLTAGSLADRLGRRRVWTVGLCVFTIASLCCGAAPSSIMLDVARGVQGVGAAVMFAVAPALIAQDFHGRERGNAFAVFGATTGLAIAAGPLLGGVLTELNWRWVFLLNVPLGLLALLITFTRVRESKASHGKPIDWPGLVTMTASMFALIFGVTRGESLGWSSPVTLSCLIGSAVLVVLFVAAERRSEHPMLDLSLFRNRTFDGLSFATFCFNLAVGVVVLFAVLWVQDILDTSALQTGIQFLPLTVVLFISGAIGGILSAKWPIRVLMGGALLFAGVGELLMSLAGAHDSWTALLPGLVMAGVGMGVHNPPRANAAIALVPQDDAGMGSGINETFQQSGFAFGVAVLGAVAHSHIISHFKAALAGHGLSPAQLAHGASAVSSGAIKPVVAGVPPALRATVHNAAVDSFTSGFHVVLIAGAIVTLVGGVVAFVLIRTKDFLVDPASVMTAEADQQAAEATSEPQLEPKSAPDPPRAREGTHVGLAQEPDHSYQRTGGVA